MRARFKVEVDLFLMHYLADIDSNSLKSIIGTIIGNLGVLVEFGRWWLTVEFSYLNISQDSYF